MKTMPTIDRVESFRVEIEHELAKLASRVPSEDRLRSRSERAGRRMVYQAEKLKRRFHAAQRVRRDAMARQVTGACQALAPWGRLQERELAGFQFVFRHSRALPQRLYESIDIWNFEHQLIQL